MKLIIGTSQGNSTVSAIELTDEDLQKLGTITTRDEAGTHFTQIYQGEWLDRMEAAGMLNITHPIHEATSIP